MISRPQPIVGDRQEEGEAGHTLVELLAVIALLGLILVAAVPQLQTQLYERELEHTARQLIYHAQFARQNALYTGNDTILRPQHLNSGNHSNWESGWQVQWESNNPHDAPIVIAQHTLHRHITIQPHGFLDPHSGISQIRFNRAGAAKTQQGGFVANRLIFMHKKNHTLQRHVILAASGRWRICNPREIAPRKGLSC